MIYSKFPVFTNNKKHYKETLLTTISKYQCNLNIRIRRYGLDNILWIYKLKQIVIK